MNEEIRNFKLGELIATGGMAAIYKGVQVSLNREVAIKILHSHLAQDESFILRFEREAKSAASLQHENVIAIIDFGKEGDRYFLAMEYVDGPSLKELIAQGPVPIEITLTIITEILKGISYAHQSGVIHRDLKPGNIMIDRRGIVKIGDFGLAKAQDTATVTVTGSIVGTPAYMSPEQASGATVDHRSDLFSIGVIAYELITGKKPFPGETYSMVINSLLSKEAKPLSNHMRHIPKRMESIIEKLLKKDPDQRYQDAQKVLSDIDDLCADTSIVRNEQNIKAFIDSKEHYLKEIRKKQVDSFYNRGLHFLNLGMGKIDNAIDQFSLVLLLDPENAKAREVYEDLKRKKKELREEKEKEKEEVKKDKRKKKKEVTKVKKPKKKKSKAPLIILIAGIVVVAVLIGGYFLYQKYKGLIGFLGGFDSKELITAYIETEPEGAAVIVDSIEYSDLTPMVIDSIASGRHHILLSKTNFQPVSVEESIEDDETLRYKLEPYPGVVDITIPAGCDLSIDGVQYQAGKISLDPGQHQISVTGSGVKFNKNININPAETTNIKVTKQANPVISVRSFPSATLFIDGRNYGFTPKTGITLKPGRHTILLRKPGFSPMRKFVYLKPNDTKNYSYRLRRIKKRRKKK